MRDITLGSHAHGVLSGDCRQAGLQVSGGRPALARSWLINDCCVELMIGVGHTFGWATGALARVVAVAEGVKAGAADGASRVCRSCLGKGRRWTAAGGGPGGAGTRGVQRGAPRNPPRA